MNKAFMLAGVLWTVGLTGCATMPPENLTPVEVGTSQSEDSDLENTILYFPAGKPLRFHITADGSIFERSIDHTETFVLNRDIYVWRDLVSFDGKHWQSDDKVMSGEVAFYLNAKEVRFKYHADLRNR